MAERKYTKCVPQSVARNRRTDDTIAKWKREHNFQKTRLQRKMFIQGRPVDFQTKILIVNH